MKHTLVLLAIASITSCQDSRLDNETTDTLCNEVVSADSSVMELCHKNEVDFSTVGTTTEE